MKSQLLRFKIFVRKVLGWRVTRIIERDAMMTKIEIHGKKVFFYNAAPLNLYYKNMLYCFRDEKEMNGFLNNLIHSSTI